MLAKPIRQLTQVNGTIQRGLAAADSIFVHLDDPLEVDTGRTALGRAKGEIVFEKVNFSYGKPGEEVLKDVSFTIKPGSMVEGTNLQWIFFLLISSPPPPSFFYFISRQDDAILFHCTSNISLIHGEW